MATPLSALQDTPEDVVALRVVGAVPASDLECALAPRVEELRRRGTRARLLLELDEGAAVAGEPAPPPGCRRRGGAALRSVAGCALVGDLDRLSEAARLAGLLSAVPVRAFPAGARADAVAWLRSLADDPRFSLWLDPDDGVLVVEIDAPLRPGDVDAMTAAVDGWLAIHAALPGMVLSTPVFPGWTNVTALVHHVRSVRDHRGRVRRVALVVADPLVALVPRMAGHVVHAEVRAFGFDDLPAAIAWAGAPGRGPERAAPPRGGPAGRRGAPA